MNQRALKALFYWVIWFTVTIVGYAQLYQGTDVVEFIKHDNSRITWLIMAVFVFGAILSLLLVLALTFEWAQAYDIERRGNERGLEGLDSQRLHRMLGRYLRNLKYAVSINASPDPEQLLNVEMGGYRRTNHFIEVLGNLLITLGLIGTIVGLTLTLTGLTGSLKALGNDQELLIASLRDSMAGMGTAFYTTLLGAALGGVVLRVFALISEHSIDALHDMIMRLCIVYFGAELKPSANRDIHALEAELERLRKNVVGLDQAFADSASSLARFRNEVQLLRQPVEEEETETSLHQAVKMQDYYCHLLKAEIEMLNTLNSPWRIRWRHLFRHFRK
ncbi:MAG: MotA/TolQ/ExbB proton channel family protein [Gammaproteobacteria bacterium]|nr:MotA/TolQ/ExbB proton channel family protein [Gammaproteobacteria bacterium]